MSREKLGTREKLLAVAERITLREGALKLTLDAVAREAEVSKGGLLYHFPNKEALIRGMIERLLERSERDAARRIEDFGRSPGSQTRAFVESTFVPDEEELDTSAGLLAAVANDPTLLEPVRESFAAWQERIENDGIDPALATLVRLAADGLWMADLFGLAPPDGELREQVIQTMLKLIETQRVSR